MKTHEKKILTARVSVAVNTQPTTPVIYRITSQFPILEKIGVFFWPSGTSVTNLEAGWKLTSNGQMILPAMGSIDALTTENYASVNISWPFRNEYLPFAKLGGPPYNFEILLYNTDGAQAVWAFFDFTFSDEILLPDAPIVADQKKND